MILYSIGCPNCKTLKILLQKHNFEFQEETSVDKMNDLGITEIPMLYTGEKLLNFNEAKNWIMKEVANEK